MRSEGKVLIVESNLLAAGTTNGQFDFSDPWILVIFKPLVFTVLKFSLVITLTSCFPPALTKLMPPKSVSLDLSLEAQFHISRGCLGMFLIWVTCSHCNSSYSLLNLLYLVFLHSVTKFNPNLHLLIWLMPTTSLQASKIKSPILHSSK